MIKDLNNIQITSTNYEIDNQSTDGLELSVYLSNKQSLDFYNVPTHWHNEFEICYAIQGHIDLCINNILLKVNAGDIVFINSNRLHLYGKRSNDWEGISIVFDKSLLLKNNTNNKLYQKYLSPFIDNTYLDFIFIDYHNDDYIFVVDHIFKIYSAMENNNYGYEFELMYSISKIMTCLIKFIETDKIYNYIPDERINTIITFIKNHPVDYINIEDLSKILLCSKRECFRYFNKHFNTTPLSFIHTIKIKQAIDLLLYETMSIDEISNTLGYSSTSYFIKKFKEITELTPAKYRKSALSKDNYHIHI